MKNINDLMNTFYEIVKSSGNTVVDLQFAPLCRLIFQHYQDFDMPSFSEEEFEPIDSW